MAAGQTSRYLEKPFSALQLKYAIDLALLRIQGERDALSNESELDKNFIMLTKNGKTWYPVAIQEIFLIESYGNYCKFHIGDTYYLHRLVLRDFGSLVKQNEIVRIHRKYVINVRFLEEIDLENNQVKIRDQFYPLSRRFRITVNQLFHRKIPRNP